MTLIKANQEIRNNRPSDHNVNCCEFFQESDLLEIAIPTHRCIHDRQGGCIMCNFGTIDASYSDEKILFEVDKFLSSNINKFRTVLLCTNGSFLDSGNISVSLRDKLLNKINNSTVNTVIIETHVDTLSFNLLEDIKKQLPKKSIIIEVGLETINTFIQKNCYLKSISVKKLSKMIKYGEHLHIRFQLNIILGAPFISRFDRFNDTRKTIQWALDNNALVTLFPMNIKPYTLLQYAYLNELYKPISHWEVPLMLDFFDDSDLANIDIAWYGNREIEYDNHEKTIFPTDCALCHTYLQKFYSSYTNSKDGKTRKQLVRSLLKQGKSICRCLESVNQSFVETENSINNQVMASHQKLSALLNSSSNLLSSPSNIKHKYLIHNNIM